MLSHTAFVNAASLMTQITLSGKHHCARYARTLGNKGTLQVNIVVKTASTNDVFMLSVLHKLFSQKTLTIQMKIMLLLHFCCQMREVIFLKNWVCGTDIAFT